MKKRYFLVLLFLLITLSGCSFVNRLLEEVRYIINGDYYTSPPNFFTNNENPEKISDLYYGVMPSIGDVKVLVLMIEFSDKAFEKTFTDEYINKIFFDNTNENSVTSFYNKSSYGKLNLTGDVLWYTAEKNSKYYNSQYKNYAPDIILEEVMEYFDDNIDYNDYDSNDDGYIDGLYLIYSRGYDSYSNLWWAFHTFYSGIDDIMHDDTIASNYVWMSSHFFLDNYTGNDISTCVHETGHMLGLDDYYDYNTSKGPGGGLGGADLMDGTCGDHSSISKILLGWITPIVIDTSELISITITLEEFVDSGDVILITADKTKGIFSEYFLVDFFTPNGINQSNYFFTTSGVRIYHVNATVGMGGLGGRYVSCFEYDNSDTSQKFVSFVERDGKNSILYRDIAGNGVLYQVNDSLGFMTSPSNILHDSSNPNFYLVVQSMAADKCTIYIESTIERE